MSQNLYPIGSAVNLSLIIELTKFVSFTISMNTTEQTVQHLQLKKKKPTNHVQILSNEYNSDQTRQTETLKGLNVLAAK